MNQAKRAAAAGSVALAAFLLVGGPAPTMASARPDDSGSHSDGDRHGQRGERGGQRDGQRAARNAAGQQDRQRDGDRRRDGGPADRPASTSSGSSSSGSANRTATANTGGTASAARVPQTADNDSPSVAATEDRPSSPIVSAGSDMTVVSPVPEPPTVTFGSGRQPAPPADRPVISIPVLATTIAPVPLAVVVPAPAPDGIRQAPVQPGARLDLSALHTWNTVRPGQPLTSWFGIAGLVLIPLAGAALGYRQARAARASEVLLR